MKIGFALTASYCTIRRVLEEIKKAVDLGYDVVPIASYNALQPNRVFGKDELNDELKRITGKDVLSDVFSVEPLGPNNTLDILAIAPLTGTSLSNIAKGVSDTSVTMAAKCTMRNQKPVVIAISTNDGLGANFPNVATLFNTKGIYFVPFGQDDPINKHNSLVANFDLLIPTVEAALEGKQYQPVLEKEKTKIKT